VAIGYVRPARPDDAGDIARIQLTTWRVAYRRLLPRDVLDQIDEDWLVNRWRAAVETPPSVRHRVLLAIEQAERDDPARPKAYPVGFAAAGPADAEVLAPDEAPDALGPRAAAITDLLVEPRWGRRGHGSRLLAACVDVWRSDGFSTAVSWAYEQDPATRAFLTSAGWEPDGARRALDVNDLLIHQVRLHTTLPEA
jgi:GNAT superfamily N-acetyltransferase